MRFHTVSIGFRLGENGGENGGEKISYIPRLVSSSNVYLALSLHPTLLLGKIVCRLCLFFKVARAAINTIAILGTDIEIDLDSEAGDF